MVPNFVIMTPNFVWHSLNAFQIKQKMSLFLTNSLTSTFFCFIIWFILSWIESPYVTFFLELFPAFLILICLRPFCLELLYYLGLFWLRQRCLRLSCMNTLTCLFTEIKNIMIAWKSKLNCLKPSVLFWFCFALLVEVDGQWNLTFERYT